MSFKHTTMICLFTNKNTTMEVIKGTFLSTASLYILNFRDIILNPTVSALLTTVISVLTVIWLCQKLRESRLSIRLKRKELDDGSA